MSYIYKYRSRSGIINDDRNIEDSILSMPDSEFSNRFTKVFRFFRNEQATRVLRWAKKEIEPILDSHISINKIRLLEKSDKLGVSTGNSLQFIPGSHHENIPGSLVETNYGLRPKIDQEWLEKNNFRFKKIERNNEVSCILFHDKLVHKGVINTESKIRFSGELMLLAARKN